MNTLKVKKMDDDPEQFKRWTKGLLHDINIEDLCITFTKADGTTRNLHCTLIESLIPEEKRPKGTGRAVTEEVQRVFDVDKGEWRSFKWDSVTEVSFALNAVKKE